MGDPFLEDAAKKAEEVIEYLAKGRIMPKQVEKLGEAVDRAKRDQAVTRALGRVWRPS